MRIRIFIVDDHEIFRQGIASLLDVPEIELVGEASSGYEALEKLQTIHPDVLILDMMMSVMNGDECARRIKEDFPKIKILVLSMNESLENLSYMIEAGVKGYVLKTGPKEELLFAIKRIVDGDKYVSSTFILNQLSNIKSASETVNNLTSGLKLSEKELEVLKLIVKGLTNQEIAQQLTTSVRTIETRRKKLLSKTKTLNTAMLIHFATLNSLV